MQEFKADDWLLYEAFSPWAGESRGLTVGFVYTRDGRHVATCVQEGLLRMNEQAQERASKL
jgi:acyl-CoA thioesterase II